jgi:GT2 family glycosyltransferase/glycosyltransferase involved in cell wall biosynthesis
MWSVGIFYLEAQLRYLKKRLLIPLAHFYGFSPTFANNDSVLPRGLEAIDKLVRQGDRWSALVMAREMYAHNKAPKLDDTLAELIGTTTQFAEVAAAVDAHFDNAYYLKSNPDVASSTSDALNHYLLYGWKEGRNPNQFFDHDFYGRAFRLKARTFPLAHYHQIGRHSSIPANGISERFWFQPTPPSEEAWNGVTGAMRDGDTETVVIMPVYKGFEETLVAIFMALTARQGSPYSLLVINDRSPDSQLAVKLQELAGRGLFDYHVNHVNQGFVKTVNLGLSELSGALDVVLLNSDAFVYRGWYERLIAHAKRDPKVATVTPFSNNATICSYPRFNQDNHAALELLPQELDEIAGRMNCGRSVEIPTGVGFCMYMCRNVIDDVGELDSQAFKVGYGEENDFCMRALKAGYKNLLAADVFVFHKGSVSFASSKDSNFSQGQKALLVKHPNYEVIVQAHITADPELLYRRNLDLARLSQAVQGCVIFVTHNWGGGIETYLDGQRERLKLQGIPSILLRVHNRHFVSIHTWPGDGPYVPNLKDIDLSIDLPLVEKLIADVAPSKIQVNSFAGLDWANHAKMLGAIERSPVPFEYVGHDYSPICHIHNLLRPDGFYTGVPDIEQRKLWARMNDGSGAQDRCDPEERRQRYRGFLSKASRIVVPSETTRAIYADEFPALSIDVEPHSVNPPDIDKAQRVTGRKGLVVALIGAIGPHKGSDVLVGLATHAAAEQLALKYHLVGYSNHDHKLQSLGVEITGAYHNESEVYDHLGRIAPDIVLIPSIWPETFCYTLSFAFNLGIPPVVFDLGAQAERVRQAGFGVCLPIDLALDSARLSETFESLNIDDLWKANIQ